MTANIDNATRKAVYRRDHYRCALCDSTDGLQIHHAIPRGKGGPSTVQNLITLCWRCHAHIHSGKQWHIGDCMTSEEAELLCIKYLSDYYADVPGHWDPWGP